MSKIKLELECDISKDQNSADLAGTKVKVAEFVDDGIARIRECKDCFVDHASHSCRQLLCKAYQRKDGRNGHWVAVKQPASTGERGEG